MEASGRMTYSLEGMRRMYWKIHLLLTSWYFFLKIDATSYNVEEEKFRSSWSEDRRWIGPEYWTNPLQEWGIKNGSVLAPAAWNRTLCILPFEVENSGYFFEMRVTINILTNGLPQNRRHKYNAGFRFARQGRVDDYRSSLIDPTSWIDAYIDANGRLTIHGTHSKENLDPSRGEVMLKLRATREDQYAKVQLFARQGERDINLEAWFQFEEILGALSLTSNGPSVPGEVYNKFSDFRLGGDLIHYHSDRNFGPIIWSQYALNGNNLKIQAHMVLLEKSILLELWVEDDSKTLKLKAKSSLDVMSRTALFDIRDWNPNVGKKFEVRVSMLGETYSWSGHVREDPVCQDILKIAAFSCDHGYGFPLPNMLEQVKSQDPDVLYFAGDQIYEIYGGFGDIRTADSKWAMMDFQRKYYQFGWTWRELMRDRPSFILPDDHDIFQGNLFGHRGVRMENKVPYNWDEGGYIMPSDWLRAVEKIHVGHLPDPAYNISLPVGIKAYFTSLVYGGVGFAVLEDRKFKTAPKRIEKWRRENGEYADLLGPEQEEFLSSWANDWRGQIMKVALSQTIFAKATTHEGPELDRIDYDHDSGGWPRDARRRVVKILGDHDIFTIHGDQHLGMLLQHGVDSHGDAGYAFMVPGTANGWPRAWWPGIDKGQISEDDRSFLGAHIDDSGHPITVLGVGNPEPGSNDLDMNRAHIDEIAYRKASGYGLVELYKKEKKAKINLFRTGRWYEQFKTFPQTIYIGGKNDNWTNPDHCENVKDRRSSPTKKGIAGMNSVGVVVAVAVAVVVAIFLTVYSVLQVFRHR